MIKILHVDDENSDHLILAERLKRLLPEVEVKWADSAGKALESIKSFQPHCIISDFQMPGRSGLDLLKSLRDEEINTPFIFYTGQGNERLAVLALREGADDYYTKEMGLAHFERLSNRIRNVVSSYLVAEERRKIEKSLAIAEKRYRTLFEQTGDYILLLNPDTLKITDLNASACEKHGYSREELIGQSIFFLDNSDFSAEKREWFKGQLLSEKEVIFETTHRCKDGSVFPVEVCAKLADISGERIIISVERDITRRKEAEAARQKHERELELLLEVSRKVNSTLNLEQIMQVLSDGVFDLINIETSAVYLLTGEDLYLWATTPPLGRDAPEELRRATLKEHPHIAEVAKNQRPLVIENTREAELSAQERSVVDARDLKSLLFLPFEVDENVFGIMILGTTRQYRSFSTSDINLCNTITNQISKSLQNALLHNRLREHVENLEEEVRQRRRTEELLAESEDFLNLAIDATRDGIFAWDLRTDQIYYSPNWKRMLGYEDDELPNEFSVWEKLTHPDDVKRAWTVQQQAVNREIDRFEVQFRMKHKDGYWMDILSRAKVIFDQDGRAVKMVGTHVDISNQKDVENQLILSEEKFRNVIESFPFAMLFYRLENDGRLVLTGANPAASKTLGVDVQNLVGLEIGEAFEGLKQTDIPELYKNIAKGKIAYESFEITYDSGEISGQYSVHVFQTAPNQMAVVFEDITEYKEMVSSLQRSESHLSNALQMGKLGHWEYDVETELFTFTDEFYSIFGTTAGEVGGYQMSARGYAQRFVHPDDHCIFAEEIEKALVSDDPGYSHQFEHRMLYADGAPGYIAVRFKVVANNDGQIIKLIGVSQDVTVQKNKEVELDRLNKELETFSYSVSHDLKAPLRHISGLIEFLAEDYSEHLDDKGKNIIKSVREAAGNMSGLTDALLQLSRLQRVDLKPQTVDLDSLARNICSSYSNGKSKRNIEFKIEDSMQVRGDAPMLSALLENLIGNAVKFTSQQPDARIEIGSMSKGNRKVFFIRDNGVGFDEKDADRLFVPFQRLHSEQEFKGTGIGLATVKRIIDRHKGSIWAEGKKGKGAAFFFTLGL